MKPNDWTVKEKSYSRADTSSFYTTQELSAHNMGWLIDFNHKQD